MYKEMNDYETWLEKRPVMEKIEEDIDALKFVIETTEVRL